MKILFVNTHYYMPQSYGGMANTLHQMCLAFKLRGHEVVVLSGFRKATDLLSFRNRLEIAARRRISGAAVSRDRRLCYPVWRSWNPPAALGFVAETEKPDIIVVMGGAVVPVVRFARRTGLPTIIQVHDVEGEWHNGDFREVVDLPLIANSSFTADVYRARYGANAQVIYPFMRLDQYKVNSSRRRVVFVNPIFRKGLRTAHEVARLCPHIPFTFVGNLPEIDEQGNPFNADQLALPNLVFQSFRTDMREVYQECRILFVPSQWEEAYGRVVNEAQVSGIPVLASRRGGLPESVGQGGLLLNADDQPEVWADVLDKMSGDLPYYDNLCKEAVNSVKRPELDPDRQMKAHEDALMITIRAVGR